jgi:catechol 2,3-dioxygenase-like lactoylglutathione lyase family enzyme
MATPIRTRKVSHVLLHVSDVERSVKFYTEILGFKESDRNHLGMVFLHPEAERIIELARDHRIGLNLGAPSHSRQYGGVDDYAALAPLVERVGVLGAAAVLDHPLGSFTVDQIASLVEGGVWAGLFCHPPLPSVIKAPVRGYRVA